MKNHQKSKSMFSGEEVKPLRQVVQRLPGKKRHLIKHIVKEECKDSLQGNPPFFFEFLSGGVGQKYRVP